VVERKMGKVTDPNSIRKPGKDPLLDFVKSVSGDSAKVGATVQQAFVAADEVYDDRLDGDDS
jgi:hypothetical protein